MELIRFIHGGCSHKYILHCYNIYYFHIQVNTMILVGVGANIEGNWGAAADSIKIALAQLNNHKLYVVKSSFAYRTAPVGAAGQAPYVNAVVSISTHLPPAALLARLKGLEQLAGRLPARRWSARPLDLDILAYHDIVRDWPGLRTGDPFAGQFPPLVRLGSLILPHPELHRRPFVVRPLLDIAPDWHHPVTGKTATQMWRNLRNLRAGRIMEDRGTRLT